MSSKRDALAGLAGLTQSSGAGPLSDCSVRQDDVGTTGMISLRKIYTDCSKKNFVHKNRTYISVAWRLIKIPCCFNSYESRQSFP